MAYTVKESHLSQGIHLSSLEELTHITYVLVSFLEIFANNYYTLFFIQIADDSVLYLLLFHLISYLEDCPISVHNEQNIVC